MPYALLLIIQTRITFTTTMTMTMTMRTTIRTIPIIRMVIWVALMIVVMSMVPARIAKTQNKNVVAKTKPNFVAMHRTQRRMTVAALVALTLKFKRPKWNLGTIYFWWHRSAKRENRKISSKPRASRTSAPTIIRRRLQENAIKRTVKTKILHQKKKKNN